MKETRFIAQNKEKWDEAEKLLKSPAKDPDKLSNLFVQIVDDLSFSRTYYANRSVRVYLNKLARQFFAIISLHKKEKQNQFKIFWLDELPQLMVFARRQMLVSLIIFLISLSIGAFSAYKDPQFVNSILGNDYVELTEKNISEGDPMAVYKQSHQVDMFLGITFNNLMVAFRTYVLGIFIGIGTIGSLLMNGVMVGCFQYFFIERGLLIQSALAIWLHGTLEISSIVLAGGAGLTLATGLVFPGTYSRLQALQISGIRSLKLMLGIAPVFILAATIESFLTRYTDAPMILKASLIIVSASFIIGYFIIYPWLKSKSGFTYPLRDVKISEGFKESIDFTKIKTDADLLKDGFHFCYKYFHQLVPTLFFVSTALTAAFFFESVGERATYVETEWWTELFTGILSAVNTPSALFILINGVAAAIVIYKVMSIIHAEAKGEKASFHTQSFIQVLLVMFMLFFAIYLGPWGILFAAISFGALLFTAFTQLTTRSGLGRALGIGVNLFRKNNNQGFLIQGMCSIVAMAFLIVLSAPLLYIHLSIIKWNFADGTSEIISRVIELFIRIFSFYLVLPLMTACISYLYFSQQEVDDAGNLKDTISKLNLQKNLTRNA